MSRSRPARRAPTLWLAKYVSALWALIKKYVFLLLLGGPKPPQMPLPGARNRPLGPRSEVPDKSKYKMSPNVRHAWLATEIEIHFVPRDCLRTNLLARFWVQSELQDEPRRSTGVSGLCVLDLGWFLVVLWGGWGRNHFKRVAKAASRSRLYKPTTEYQGAAVFRHRVATRQCPRHRNPAAGADTAHELCTEVEPHLRNIFVYVRVFSHRSIGGGK